MIDLLDRLRALSEAEMRGIVYDLPDATVHALLDEIEPDWRERLR